MKSALFAHLLVAKPRRFSPPRLPHQPFFYPLLNFDYAAQIARDWNTADKVSDFAGYVTKFEIEENYAAQFELQVVGNNLLLWRGRSIIVVLTFTLKFAQITKLFI